MSFENIKLAQKINMDEETELSVEEIVTLKTMFSVSKSQINRIIRRVNWSHV